MIVDHTYGSGIQIIIIYFGCTFTIPEASLSVSYLKEAFRLFTFRIAISQSLHVISSLDLFCLKNDP